MSTDNKEQTKLLWVKVPTTYASKLAENASSIGVSRADLMRLILINFINSESTISINTNAK